MNDRPRLIEHAFPLKQASLDSVHEKNVRHGHISTLHIWPARRPLAACRAALIATLLPDPSAEPKPEGMSDSQWEEEIKRRRKELCEKIGGKVKQKVQKKKMPNGQTVERVKEETEGGILHWKRETENADTLEWFREEIRKAYGGRAPKVLDPFAGGGAIPLEAMRLGCEATAIDINPVAWFILKCTLEYPQKLAGKTRPLPDFVLDDREFMEDFFKKAKGYTAAQTRKALERLEHSLEAGEQFSLDFAEDEDGELDADLAWHVRAWGKWVLDRARKDLAEYYPVYADFEPLEEGQKSYEPRPMKLVPLRDDGTPDIGALNADFSEEYLADEGNPRWVAKPTVAYLWARTVKCKNCRATIPLLKTQWLCKKSNKRVLLTMEPNEDKTGIVFGIESDVSRKGGNAAQRREHDKRISAGTMSRSGAECPCCHSIMTMEDVRTEAKDGLLGATLTAVVIDGPRGKEYRQPTHAEARAPRAASNQLKGLFEEIPSGIPNDSTPPDGALGNSISRYGMTRWTDVFTPRQLLNLGTFCGKTREAKKDVDAKGYQEGWADAIIAHLTLATDRLADANSTIAHWASGGEFNVNTFQRFALSMSWDFSEVNPLAGRTGSYEGQISWVALALSHCLGAVTDCPSPDVLMQSATKPKSGHFDMVITDPPYYGAIPYSDCMDFFYVWLRRAAVGSISDVAEAFRAPLGPKWDTGTNDGELIDDPSRHEGNRRKSRHAYEDGMSRAFAACSKVLSRDGRLVVVFANKDPAAWETLVSALIRAGFVVDGSWPIQTERLTRTRSIGAAALASSVWLVCKKRLPEARPGWDNKVLQEMQGNITEKLRAFWDAGIRGPDFVWAATGPALEAYSKHPVVKKANAQQSVMSVSEFLTHVRRSVVDFVVGRVLSGDEDGEDETATDKLDEPTAYYLLHRHDFGMEQAPAGTCILYAVSCGLSDQDLVQTWEILKKVSSGSKLRLKKWAQRDGKRMGYQAPGGRPVPLIDRVHRLMHLWKAGDVHKVDDYIDDNGLRRHELFKRLLQSLIELAPERSDERSILESLSNHIGAKGARGRPREEDGAFVDRTGKKWRDEE